MKILQYMDAPSKDYKTETARNARGRLVIGRADGAPNFTMRVFEIMAGGASDRHRHPWEHEVFVHSGAGRLMCEEEEYDLLPGTVVFIPGHARHQLTNDGPEPLVFVCTIPQGDDIPEI